MRHGKYDNATAMFLIDTATAVNGCSKKDLAIITKIPYQELIALYRGFSKLNSRFYEILEEASKLNY